MQLRSFLGKIEVSEFEEIIEIDHLAKIIKDRDEAPTLYKVKEYQAKILAGIITDRESVSLGLDTTKENIIPNIIKKLDYLKPYDIKDSAPFLKNQIQLDSENTIDRHLPVIDFYAGKKYTTSSVVIIDYPDENRQNASFHRMMHISQNKFSIRIVAQRHLDNAYQHAVKSGKDLNVAVVFGIHPAIEIASAFSAPELDELELASSFLNGLDVFRLPNGILVPSESEFVIEARITSDLANEGPFIDLTGTADRVRKQPILVADTLYFRDDPIFRTILPGGKEHKMLMGIPQEPRIFKAVSNTIPTVKNVVLTQGGCSWLHAVVQIEKRTEGDPKNAILASLAAHPSLKRVIIVDEDIDLTDPNEVEWAVATRFQADTDLILVPKSKGSSLDPSSKDSITCKYGMDATKPITNNEEFNKAGF
ncbi:MAG: UbiD family decarboxylase [Candidatus Lokiarchaeota archaeon]|nr:UbiD family decarboxylase [Candidatus Lokiarchaeota archaeon]